MSTTIQHDQKFSEARFELTPDFANALEQLQVTLLVSTYQAGKLLVIGSHAGKLSIAFHGFDQVMGVAVSQDRIAIGTRRQIYFLNPAHEFAPRIEPFGTYDRCWLTRSSFVTGSIHGHGLAWSDEGLWRRFADIQKRRISDRRQSETRILRNSTNQFGVGPRDVVRL